MSIILALSYFLRDIDPGLATEEAMKEKSYQIIGSMAESGLGCVQWWAPAEEAFYEKDDDEEDQETD